MRLSSSKKRTEHLRQRLTVLETFSSLDAGRPCGGCQTKCSLCGSKSCTCQCSSRCSGAKAALSSDAKYPIEAGILATVYELNWTGAFECFWSCEGHTTNMGEQTSPRVWFYCHDLVAPELLVDHLNHVSMKQRLQGQWAIEFLGKMGRLEAPALQLRPASSCELSLPTLRQELDWITNQLRGRLLDRVKVQLSEIKSELGGCSAGLR